MKKILLPTDFSENSYKAIEYALKVYKNIKCTFYLLHTYNPTVYQAEYLIGSPGLIGLGDVMRETAVSRMDELKNKIETEHPNPKHTIKTHTVFNTLLNEILEMTTNEKIDLVVMGTKGASGAQEILFGSNAVSIIKRTKCPVIVVPDSFDYEAPKEILFPTDFEITYPKKEIEGLLQIVKQHQSQINILHVRTGNELDIVQKEHKKQLDQLLVNYATFHDVPDNEIIAAVNDFQLKKKINLLVMIQNKHTFFERLFMEPIIKKIGFHVNVPLMVIPQL
ncbi:universal stress protein [Cellulophaga sp. Z1A5H]|uniref:universal stress protein n=1 Tax=Cellulophaga sp. Z1A5H TaxID=2687291 RepID=UPI0013FD2C25|nr:universal stress protein [Cellulophaga sp. Z1A5H]